MASSLCGSCAPQLGLNQLPLPGCGPGRRVYCDGSANLVVEDQMSHFRGQIAGSGFALAGGLAAGACYGLIIDVDNNAGCRDRVVEWGYQIVGSTAANGNLNLTVQVNTIPPNLPIIVGQIEPRTGVHVNTMIRNSIEAPVTVPAGTTTRFGVQLCLDPSSIPLTGAEMRMWCFSDYA